VARAFLRKWCGGDIGSGASGLRLKIGTPVYCDQVLFACAMGSTWATGLHTQTHTHFHTHAHTRTFLCVLWDQHALKDCIHIHTHTHTHIHIHTQTHTHTYTHNNLFVRAMGSTCAQGLHTQTHTYFHTHAHTQQPFCA